MLICCGGPHLPKQLDGHYSISRESALYSEWFQLLLTINVFHRSQTTCSQRWRSTMVLEAMECCGRLTLLLPPLTLLPYSTVQYSMCFVPLCDSRSPPADSFNENVFTNNFSSSYFHQFNLKLIIYNVRYLTIRLCNGTQIVKHLLVNVFKQIFEDDINTE